MLLASKDAENVVTVVAGRWILSVEVDLFDLVVFLSVDHESGSSVLKDLEGEQE